jgi:hypothetical protein
MRRFATLMIALFLALSAASTPAAEMVTALTAAPTPGQWYGTTTGAGTVGIVDISSAGGNLQNNAPLPPGAVLMTTGFASDGDRAEVGMQGNFGTASAILSGLQISYSYYKGSSADPNYNAAAAPALKLSFLNPAAPGDNFVTLVYEPYFNQPGNPGVAVNPPANDWVTVTVDFTNGVFWQNGGFGQANSFGGGPFNTLSGWLNGPGGFNADFGNATLTNIAFGIGSYNRGQTDYLDNVSINIPASNIATTYDFDLNAATAVPEPMSLAVWSLLGASASVFAWRRNKKVAQA